MVSWYDSHMPRKSRIDAPGALHHIIARGIDRKNIFKDNKDRVNNGDGYDFMRFIEDCI